MRRTHDGFGAVESHLAEYGATRLFEEAFESDVAAVARDAAGRIVTVTENMAGRAEVVRRYEYDAAGRLEYEYEDAVEVAHYTYDDNGNRLSIDGVTDIAEYNDYDMLETYVIDEGTIRYHWNWRGQLEGRENLDTTEETLYDYDEFGALHGVDLPDGTEIDYVIDPVGRRIGRLDGTTERYWLYADALNPVAELDDTGAVTSMFIYGTRANVPDYMVRGGTRPGYTCHLRQPRSRIPWSRCPPVVMVKPTQYGYRHGLAVALALDEFVLSR